MVLVDEIEASGGSASFAPCDLSTAGGAAALAVSLQARGPIALLVNNAGSMGGSEVDTLTVNAVAPTVLTIGLMPSLAASPAPRVVNVASSAHLRAGLVNPALLHSEKTDRSLAAYAQSKLALLHVSTLLREALPAAPNLEVLDAHPGLAWTPMLRRAVRVTMASKPWLACLPCCCMHMS